MTVNAILLKDLPDDDLVESVAAAIRAATEDAVTKAVEEEREACAKTAEAYWCKREICVGAAHAIRARGETK